MNDEVLDGLIQDAARLQLRMNTGRELVAQGQEIIDKTINAYTAVRNQIFARVDALISLSIQAQGVERAGDTE